ncbi:MAG TPA: DUF4405 domain-containing protein [Phycisphaerae bacterium]|nr:DUF4405 domain-containing protein [Phycisphaerae bacterium]
MSRQTINFLLDGTLLVAFLSLLWISVLLRAIFPEGTLAAGWSLWGLGYDAWCKIQFAALLAFALCVLLHLILHWSWVCGFITGRLTRILGRRISTNESTRTAYGVTTLIAILSILGTLLFFAQLGTRGPAGTLHP